MSRNSIIFFSIAFAIAGCRSKTDTTITYDTSARETYSQTPPTQPMAQNSQPGAQPSGEQPQSQQITIGPKHEAQPQGEPQGQPQGNLSLNAKPDIAPTPGKAPTPELAPQLPPASAMRKHGDTTISPTGLKYIDTKVGTGPMPKPGEFVSVGYVGKLTNGNQFDESTSFTTQIGVGQVILGWDEGMLTMRTGGKRRFIIPPALAYGPKGMPPTIPPNATLIFDVELILIQQ
jgi:hypothetical protein